MNLNVMMQCPFCIKAIIVADIFNQKLKIVEYKYEDLKKEKYLKINPLGLVPSLQHEDQVINDSKAVCYYIINISESKELKTKFQGENLKLQTEIIQWVSFGDNLISTLIAYLKKMFESQEDIDKKTEVLFKKLNLFEERLHTKTYLVSNNLTMADINLFALLAKIYEHFLDEKDRNKFKNLTRWFKHIASSNYYVNRYGEFKYCKKRPTFEDFKSNNI